MQEGGGPSDSGGGSAQVPPPPKLSRKEKIAQDEALKQEVSEKLQSGDYSLVFIDEGKPNQSPAWKKFARVAISATGELLKFVQCRNEECSLIKMLTSGRGNLADHSCKAKPKSKAKQIPDFAVDKFTESLAVFVAEKLLPTTVIEGESFRNIIKSAMEVAVEYGNIDPETLIPHPCTLARRLKSMADKSRLSLVEELQEDLKYGFGSATVDGWTDSQRGRKYLTHTVSVIDRDWKLRDHVLFTPHCKAESVTAAVINNEIKENLAKINLDPDLKLHYVTDDGADIVCAVQEQDRSYCADHCTNLVVKKGMKLQLTKIDLYGKDGGVILDKVQSAVRAIKKSRFKKYSLLKSKLKVGPLDRLSRRCFASSIPMIKSVKSNFQQVKTAAKELAFDCLGDVSASDLQTILNVISPLEKLAISAKDKCFVASHFENVKNITAPAENDSAFCQNLKIHITKELVPMIELLRVIKNCKEVVTYFKTSGLNDQLPGGSLKQEVDTRWVSVLHLLRSFFTNKSSKLPWDAKLIQINKILKERKKEELIISAEDQEIMEHLIVMLEKFETAIKKFEASKTPSIQYVFPQFIKLKKFLAPHADDSEIMAKFRSRLLTQLNSKMGPNINIRHKVAAFLWPKYALLSFMSSEESAEVHAEVRKMYARHAIIIEERTPASPSKRQKLIESSDSDDSMSGPALDEVDRYILMRDPKLKTGDLLTWWKEKSPAFPVLSQVARTILATPASSSASERLFSVAGQLITAKRNCLSPETVDDTLFLHDYLKKK